ncbi:MlaD family protein [Magnetospirillum molischianum]|uniref:Mammalian cell entry related n=1 Tax=Magnetospirillum molischianum DSM 120 TaxID=1150626 RepID=H8FX78_MAGML|nr:MlaD family protein [Magnetospirillum molischianum]CCG42966.1 Mammalian cell entry related [Magnetospirillum molischianum DSM 120]
MKASPTAVGGFVLGGLLLAVAAILFLGGMRLFTPTLGAVVFFPTSVAGLTVGAPVTFRGVRIGSVSKILLRLNVDDRSSLIPAYLELDADRISWEDTSPQGVEAGGDPGIPRLVHAGLRAALSTPNLVTGQLGVDLDFHPDSPILAHGPAMDVPEIPSIPSDLQNLKDKFIELPLRELVDETRTTLSHMVAVFDVLGLLVDESRKTAIDARETLRVTSAAVRTLGADAGRTLGDIDRLTLDGRRVLETAERTTRHAESLMASLDSLSQPRSDMRDDLEATLRDLAASASSLRSFTRDLERSPIDTLRRQ